MVETMNRVNRTSRRLLQEYGREPTPEEIAEAMNLPVERVLEISKISQEPVSLDPNWRGRGQPSWRLYSG